MTSKRFVKLMLAYGLDRNTANDLSKIFRRINIGYFDLYRPILTLNKTKEPLVMEQGKSFAFEMDAPDLNGYGYGKRKEGADNG